MESIQEYQHWAFGKRGHKTWRKLLENVANCDPLQKRENIT